MSLFKGDLTAHLRQQKEEIDQFIRGQVPSLRDHFDIIEIFRFFPVTLIFQINLFQVRPAIHGKCGEKYLLSSETKKWDKNKWRKV